LKYINGDQTIPEEIKMVLQYPIAFFLERHATVKKLLGFGIENMKQLKCCVVGECNEVEVIIDETDAHKEDVVLGSLEYLCIYYMKNLRKIWAGPIQPKCLPLLKFLTLRTCPELTTIFTKGLLDNLCSLEEFTIDDCPSIKTLVSCEVSAEYKTSHFLLNLKRMSLHYMPRLVSISSGLHIAPRLEWLSFYDCPNLKNMSIEEVSSKDLKKIEGERSWWEALEWSSDHPAYLDDIFVPINIEF
jgi:disease resistance protein RPS2